MPHKASTTNNSTNTINASTSPNAPKSLAEKALLIFILAFMSSIAPLSTDMYLPALPNVSKSFGVDDFFAELSLASFFIAFAFGQLIYGPLSDVFGRKKPLYIGLLLFITSSIGCVLVDSIYVFIALRFFEALGGCAGVVIARAIVNDRFALKDAASIFALMMMVSSIAPMLAPTLGSMLLKFFTWQKIFLVLFLLGIALFLLIIFALKESAPNLEKARFSHKETIKHYKIILSDKVFMSFVLSGALAMGAMFAYITGSSFVFIKVFELEESVYSAIFAINALGLMTCSMINARLVRSFSPFLILRCAFLAMAFFALVLLGVGVSLGGALGLDFIPKGLQIIIFEVSLFVTMSMLGFLLPNLTTLAMARFKEYSGTASAILGMVQFAIAGLVSFAVGAIGANTPFMLSCVMALAVWLGASLFLAFGAKHAKQAQ